MSTSWKETAKLPEKLKTRAERFFQLTKDIGFGEALRRAQLHLKPANYPFTAIKTRQFRHQFSGWNPGHPFAVWHVDPDSIERYVDNIFQKFPNTGNVVPGEWDRAAEPLSSSGKYSLLDGFFRGEIEAADLTPAALRTHGYNGTAAETYTELGYGQYLESLKESIDQNGFHSAEQTTDSPPGTGKYDCVTVNVSRDGELLFAGNGFHRLVIAKTFGYDVLPVRVKVVHRQWAAAHDGLTAHPDLTFASKIPFGIADVLRLDFREVGDANTGYFPEQ